MCSSVCMILSCQSHANDMTYRRDGGIRVRLTRLCSVALLTIFFPFSAAYAQTVQVTLRDGSIQPGTIQSTRGQEVHVLVQNRGLNVHNFVLPAFYVFTQNLQPGQRVDVRFTPDKTGAFQYYSDKSGVPEPGMFGTIQVR